MANFQSSQQDRIQDFWVATSRWVWSMFCIATFYKSQLKVKRGHDHPYQPPSGFIPFCSRHHAFKSDAVPVQQSIRHAVACGGARVSQATITIAISHFCLKISSAA